MPSKAQFLFAGVLILLAGCVYLSALSIWDAFNPSGDTDGVGHFAFGIPFYIGTIVLASALFNMNRGRRQRGEAGPNR